MKIVFSAIFENEDDCKQFLKLKNESRQINLKT